MSNFANLGDRCRKRPMRKGGLPIPSPPCLNRTGKTPLAPGQVASEHVKSAKAWESLTGDPAPMDAEFARREFRRYRLGFGS